MTKKWKLLIAVFTLGPSTGLLATGAPPARAYAINGVNAMANDGSGVTVRAGWHLAALTTPGFSYERLARAGADCRVIAVDGRYAFVFNSWRGKSARSGRVARRVT